ncbi:hypothetical protein WS67_08765 [Burkholderia singularis]|uniref:Uncharacterized protein n=1 Tax=Burkholderia singularis TaxID=1503053 RepID=A0A103E5L5_9BURK|nr:hypothetical protein WS67_08765 [Burkholderia singularis]
MSQPQRAEQQIRRRIADYCLQIFEMAARMAGLAFGGTKQRSDIALPVDVRFSRKIQMAAICQ